MIEELKGQAVHLRRVRQSDAESIVTHIHDLRIARNTFIPYPYKPKDANAFIRNAHLEWRKGTGYHFGLVDPETDKVVGGLGLEGVTKKHRNAELGYWLSRFYRGHGMMSEAVGLALKFSFQELRLVRVHAHVMNGNDSSIRVLERAGFQPEGYMRKRIKHRGRWRDLHLFSILAEDWRG